MSLRLSNQIVRLPVIWAGVAAEAEMITLNECSAADWSVAFNLDGHTPASASEDQAVKLWNAVSYQPLETLRHESSVWSVAFSPDGKTLASAHGNILGGKDFAIRLGFAAADEEVAKQRNK